MKWLQELVNDAKVIAAAARNALVAGLEVFSNELKEEQTKRDEKTNTSSEKEK